MPEMVAPRALVFRPPVKRNEALGTRLDLCLRETGSEKSHDYRDVIVFEKLCFQNVFRPHENEKPSFSNSSGLKSVFEKLLFRDRLVWTVGLTVEIKLRFQISLAQYGRCVSQQCSLLRA